MTPSYRPPPRVRRPGDPGPNPAQEQQDRFYAAADPEPDGDEGEEQEESVGSDDSGDHPPDQSCGGCHFFRNQKACLRFPEARYKDADSWCGEFSPKQADANQLDERQLNLPLGTSGVGPAPSAPAGGRSNQ